MALGFFAPRAGLVETQTPGIIAFVALWAGLNGLLAFLVIREAVRCARNKRRDYRFEIPLPLRIVRPWRTPRTAVVDDISEDGMTLRDGFLNEVEAGQALEGTLYVPGGSLPFRAVITDLNRNPGRGRPPVADCRFEWASAADRDRLDRSLHSCAWHRRFCFAGGYFRTPLEILADLLFGAKASGRLPPPDWQPALCHAPGEVAADARFCVIAADPGSPARLLSFQPLPIGSLLEVQPLGRPWPGAKTALEVMEEGPPTGLSSGLDDVQVYEYRLRTPARELAVAPVAPPLELRQRRIAVE